MAQKLFKGFKQVVKATYDEAVKNSQVSGYIWFVRTPIDANGVEEGQEGYQDDSNINNDSYDIYFGTKHYGHYSAGDKAEVAILASALANIKASVGLENNYSFLPSPEGLVTALDTKFADTKGKHTVKEAIDLLYTNFEDYKATNDAALNKVAVDIVYTKKGALLPGELENGKTAENASLSLKLKDNTYTSPINVQDFIMDGMIDTVTMVEDPEKGKVIRFTWNTEAGKEVTDIKVSDLFQAYVSADGSIKIDGNDLAIAKVTFEKAFASEKIPVAGGPLASDAVKKLFPNGIDTSMSMQDVLMTLFCKEEWPSPEVFDGSISATVESSKIINKLTPSGTVEVGTKISYTVSGQATTESHSVRKAEGFTNGYATDVKGNGASTATSKSASIVSGPTVSSYGDIQVSGAATASCVKSVEHPNGTTLTGDFTVAEAKKYTLTATEKPNVYSIEYGTLPVLYGKSNIGKYKEDCKSAEKNSNITQTSTQTAQSKSASVTGDYKYFEGWATKLPENKSEIIALNHKTGWLGTGFTLTGEPLGEVPAQNIHCIAVPSGCRLTSLLNGMNLESKGSYTESGDVDYALANGTIVKYHIFYQAVKANFKYNKVVITK